MAGEVPLGSWERLRAAFAATLREWARVALGLSRLRAPYTIVRDALASLVLHRLLRRLGRRARRRQQRGRLGLLSADVSRGQRDLLQHQPIAESLAEAIRGTPDEDTLGVALYGGWGQGKSMIGRLLKEALAPELEQGAFVFVKVDAWKYAHKDDRQPLRRHFLISAYKEAGLRRQARFLQTLFETEFTGSISRFYSPLRLRSMLVPVGVVLAVAIALIVGSGVFHDHPRWAVAVTALIAPMAVYGLSVLNAHLRVSGRVDPFRSIEDFDEALDGLLRIARDRQQFPVRRFIFFIDDLDRCGDELVLEAIETLQAFFGRPYCAYIVAADREQLRRAVRVKGMGIEPHVAQGAPVPADDTFLEKIFQTSIDVPPPLPETLTGYGEALADECGLGAIVGAGQVASVLDALIHTGVRSPRQARVLLNEFLLAHEQAVRRQADDGTHLAHKPLTSSPRRLATFTVLRVHFSWFYELLFDHPALLPRLYDFLDALELNTTPDVDAQDAAVRVHDAAARAAGEESAEHAVGERTPNGTSALPSSRAEEAGKATALDIRGRTTRLYDGLLDYLLRTTDAQPSDEPQVQEFLYLRGRELFEDLPGAAGNGLRDAIANGASERALGLIGDHPELALPAARVALRQTTQAASRQARQRARNVFLALLGQLEAGAVETIGEQAARDLYRDDHEREKMPHDVALGVARLIPFLDFRSLSALIDLGGLATGDDVRLLARRPRLGEEVTLWASAVEAAIAGSGSLAALTQGMAALPPAAVVQLAEVASSRLESVLTAPAERIHGQATIDGWGEDELLLNVTLEGTAYQLAVPSELQTAATTLSIGGTGTIAAHRRADESWLAETVESITVGATTLVSEATEADGWKLLEQIEEHLGDEVADALVGVLCFDFARGGNVARALALVARALRRHRLADPTAAASVVLGAQPLVDALAKDAAPLLGALLRLPAETLKEAGPRIGAVLATRVPELEPGEREAISQDVRQARTRLPKAAFAAAVVAALPTRRGIQDLAIEVLVAPYERPRAARLYVANEQARLQELDSGTLDAAGRSTVEKGLRSGLRRLLRIASESREMQRTVASLPFRTDWSWYAGTLLVLRARVGLRELPPDDFLDKACRFGLEALVACARLLKEPLTDGQRDAVLAGVGEALLRGDAIPPEVSRVLGHRERPLPKLEQAARIAELVSPEAAEFFDKDVPARLLGRARRSFAKRPGETRRLVALLGPWRVERAHRLVACEVLTQLFRTTKTQAQLAALLGAALDFFGTRHFVTGVGLEPLRAAGWDATRRVSRSGRRRLAVETIALLQQANDTLGWDAGRKTPSAYRRIFS